MVRFRSVARKRDSISLSFGLARRTTANVSSNGGAKVSWRQVIGEILCVSVCIEGVWFWYDCVGVGVGFGLV